ncbi:helix-turn-helix domain-containing protein [Marinobacter salinexigens]|uniref:Helix-turn-helix domain-containing protein n=1 Tax=Marinobacter salinexigens TaxID=2919747 RepID=A0A5B0VIR5_9GAMM|nr:RodZ domain-containing protein [Marinobacter salinexigens]KAA1173881.1 helix-turn-helix domain-containing protein [Marinobacter salinexigens]
MANEDVTQPVNDNPVGLRLKKARESRGLDVNDIANVQHLRPAVIQAIEAGDYGKIDSELFLKGYVRAYAVHVGLDADRLIADLDQELEPMREQRKQEFEASPLVDIERRRSRKRRAAKAVFLLAIIGLVAWVVVHFLLPAQQTVAPDSQEPGEVIEESAPASDAEAPGPSVPESVVEDVSVEEPVPDSEAVSDAEPVAEDVASESVEEPSVETVAAEVEVPVQSEEGVVEVLESDQPESVSEPSVQAIAADNTGRLQISFVRDCWVRISDSNGNRLVSSLQRAGDNLDVVGDLPLTVVIGAVDAVSTISFQGEPLEMGDYPVVNNRSEFTLTI